ncbi:hypothetical protein CUMW_259100 [Citrus unshiu]|nr:hypothetical protein CUMW_259100 [Citrus unshiu]
MSIGSAYTSGRYVFLVAFISGRLLFNPVFCSYHIAETIRAGAEPVAWPTWCLYVLNTGSRAGYEMRSSLTEVLPVTEPKENETISTQQLAVASEWRLLRKFSSGCNAITIILSLRKHKAEQDCGKEKDFSESLNSDKAETEHKEKYSTSCGLRSDNETISMKQIHPKVISSDVLMAPHVIAKKVIMSEAAVLFISLNLNLSLWITQEVVGSKFMRSVDNDEQKESEVQEKYIKDGEDAN